MKAVIVEDEQISREILINYLSKYCPEVEVIAQATDVDEALQVLRKTDMDLVFLDVELPYGTAFDILEKVGQKDFETIFVTAYDQYAKDALNMQAAYYLTKPIEIDELIKAVDTVKNIRAREEELQVDLKLHASSPVLEDKITIPTQEGFEVLAINEITYCQADDNYTHVHLTNDTKLVSKTLKHFEELLDDKGFCRIHKSYLINTSHVTAYKKGKGGSVIVANTELSVSPSKKSSLFSYFK
ncbi:LytR family transcriptional regulator [Nonlabens sp. MIC269]|uniref:LytR/AlgR family response regulator transcription factor n=1 Tax=unclassified Nonlabens TaxID=2615035 RepID=UPI000721F6CF|nr:MULTISPECIES: LytTR family DNA-binding domain-containing protein [unclassified Nonlabens]ALM20924.1 LytR family transcriptional regulator [Nonlabens sp. MIC269]